MIEFLNLIAVVAVLALPAIGLYAHYADMREMAAKQAEPVRYEGLTECVCHARMGNDFYFLPPGDCLIGGCTNKAEPARV